MRRTLTAYLAASFLLVSVSFAVADDVTQAAIAMSKLCEGEADIDKETETRACNLYLLGILDMNTAMKFGFHAPLFCPPNGVELDQLRLVVLKYVRDNPDYLDQAFGSLAISALVIAFPCKR